MAFSWREFWRGAVASLVTFNLLFLVVTTVVCMILMGTASSIILLFAFVAWFQLLFVLGISVLATVIGSCLAFGLGMLLRAVPSIRVHLAAFAGLGLAVGGLATVVVALWPKDELDGYGSMLGHITEPSILLPLLALSAASVAYGWYWTASRALRDSEPQHAVSEAQIAD